jgi:hypothetical protein
MGRKQDSGCANKKAEAGKANKKSMHLQTEQE